MSKTPIQPWRKRLYLVLGFVLMGLGFIGMAMPLMPTTIFWILAAYCFMRSRPEMVQRLRDHPRVGPGLSKWLDEGALSRRSKVIATVSIAASFGISAFMLWDRWIILGFVAAPLILVLIFLWTRPE